jgi:hypothetical protein
MMTEIGKKFEKFRNLPLSKLTKDIKSLAEDLQPISNLLQPSSESDSISLKHLKNLKIYILSQKSTGMNLYRMLNYTKPSKIFLQMRPDDVLPSNPSEEVGPEEVVSSSLFFKDTEEALRKSGFFISDSKIKVPGNDSLWRDRFSERTSLFASIWAIQHDLDHLELCDVPRKVLYRTISNTLTLMQLQSMFSHVCKTIGAKPDAFDEEDVKVPLTVSYKLSPEVWEKPSIHYIAWKLIKASNSKNPQTIFCVTNRETGTKLEEILDLELSPFNKNPPLRHSSIVRKESSEMVTEKIALLDVFSYGFGIPSVISTHPAVKRVVSFIAEMVEEERADGLFRMAHKDLVLRKEKLLALYLSRLKMYSTAGSKKIEEGKAQLKVEILKSVIKD